MGTTYHYANLTKREWLAADALGGSSKHSGLGLNLTSRAFDLLLLYRWSGDCIALIGDEDENWLQYAEEFKDLQADAILMVFASNGFERLAAAAADDDYLFMEMCHLIVTRQVMQLEAPMKEHFGTNYRQRYKELSAQRDGFKPKDVVFPASS